MVDDSTLNALTLTCPPPHMYSFTVSAERTCRCRRLHGDDRIDIMMSMDDRRQCHTVFLADRTNGRAIGTVLRPSAVVVCDAMYCG